VHVVTRTPLARSPTPCRPPCFKQPAGRGGLQGPCAPQRRRKRAAAPRARGLRVQRGLAAAHAQVAHGLAQPRGLLAGVRGLARGAAQVAPGRRALRGRLRLGRLGAPLQQRPFLARLRHARGVCGCLAATSIGKRLMGAARVARAPRLTPHRDSLRAGPTCLSSSQMRIAARMGLYPQ